MSGRNIGPVGGSGAAGAVPAVRPPDPGPPAAKVAATHRHSTSYVEAGPSDGPLVILVHGWPEVGIAWRQQVDALSRRGFRVVAPDLRGCGLSRLHASLDAYAQRHVVRDMIDLIDALGAERAVWVGHDWGAIVVSNLAHHHPERCVAVAGASQPFNTLEMGLEALVPLVDRGVYPSTRFPYGPFEYMAFYHEHFPEARTSFEADVSGMMRAVMRRGNPADAGKPFLTAFVRENGGWFGPDGRPAPDLPLDTSVLDEADLRSYVEAYRRTGLFGINAL